jgi:hypothetical protein
MSVYLHLNVSKIFVIFATSIIDCTVEIVMAGNFLCSYCDIGIKQFRKFERHLRDYHQNMPNFQVECPVSSCKANFKSVHNFRRHIERKHHSLLTSWLDCNQVQTPTNDLDASSVNSFASDTNEHDIGSDDEFEMSSHRCMNDVVNNFDKQFTMLILRLKEQYILSGAVCKELANLVLSMVTDTIEAYKDVVCQHLFANNKMPIDDEWAVIVNPAQSFKQAGRNCLSDSALQTYLKRHNLIVEPYRMFFS